MIKGKSSDALVVLLSDERQAPRFNNWLWLIMCATGRLSEANLRGPGNREWIAGVLGADHAIRNEILTWKEKSFLPEEYFDWITGETRQNWWLINHICNVVYQSAPVIPSFLIDRDLIVGLIDFLKIDLQSKVQVIEDIKMSWNRFLQNDRIFDWFGKEDEMRRCGFAWEWMREKNLWFVREKAEVDNLQDLLLLFDAAAMTQDAKILMIDKIKKAWHQRQSREKMKGKRQRNFILSDDSIKLLDRLGAKYDLKRAEIIEVLVKMEAEKETYLKEKLDRRKALLS